MLKVGDIIGIWFTQSAMQDSLLIDVRSLPKSKYFKDFDDINLSKILPRIGVKYENWRKEFGARQDNFEFYTNYAY